MNQNRRILLLVFLCAAVLAGCGKTNAAADKERAELVKTETPGEYLPGLFLLTAVCGIDIINAVLKNEKTTEDRK